MTLATERAGARPMCILRLAFCIACILTAVCGAAACGARRISLPTDPGAPLPNFTEIHAKLSTACQSARTLTAVLGLSGRAGTQRLRGRLIAGFERPASMRL